jgi:hypothetical protein
MSFMRSNMEMSGHTANARRCETFSSHDKLSRLRELVDRESDDPRLWGEFWTQATRPESADGVDACIRSTGPLGAQAQALLDSLRPRQV